ncbi:MAG: acyl carrier protein [Mycobacteriales bacterium]
MAEPRTTEEILTGLAEIINEVSGRDASLVVPEATFSGDLDLDSLTMVEVVVAAEQRFDVRIPDEDVAELESVSDAIRYIQRVAAPA